MIAPDGGVLARVVVVAEVTLLDGEESVMWGTMSGAFDIPFIVRYRISR